MPVSYPDLLKNVCDVAVKKVLFKRKSPAEFFVLAVLAGIYVGLGILLIFQIGSLLQGNNWAPLSRIIMGATFGIALSLVLFAGSELFTGNNFIFATAWLEGVVSLKETFQIWALSWFGNWYSVIY